jgi:hypothetical protein
VCADSLSNITAVAAALAFGVVVVWYCAAEIIRDHRKGHK